MVKARQREKHCRRNAILFIAGEGGHFAQACRISGHFDSSVRQNNTLVLLSDNEHESVDSFDEILAIKSCAPKDRRANVLDMIRYSIGVVKICYRISTRYSVTLVIVTGPGFALFPALYFKLLRSTLVVLESWSRFEHKSKCGMALYPFADHFWVQHKEMLALYPRASWVGLL